MFNKKLKAQVKNLNERLEKYETWRKKITLWVSKEETYKVPKEEEERLEWWNKYWEDLEDEKNLYFP